MKLLNTRNDTEIEVSDDHAKILLQQNVFVKAPIKKEENNEKPVVPVKQRRGRPRKSTTEAVE